MLKRNMFLPMACFFAVNIHATPDRETVVDSPGEVVTSGHVQSVLGMVGQQGGSAHASGPRFSARTGHQTPAVKNAMESHTVVSDMKSDVCGYQRSIPQSNKSVEYGFSDGRRVRLETDSYGDWTVTSFGKRTIYRHSSGKYTDVPRGTMVNYEARGKLLSGSVLSWLEDDIQAKAAAYEKHSTKCKKKKEDCRPCQNLAGQYTRADAGLRVERLKVRLAQDRVEFQQKYSKVGPRSEELFLAEAEVDRAFSAK